MPTYNYGNQINPNDYIYSDLNVRLPYVSPQDYTIVTDKEAVLQSVMRLLKTEEGEIPNYRDYGLNLKQFLQQPMGKDLATDVEAYVSSKIVKFEPRVDIYKVNVASDYVNLSVILQYYLKIKSLYLKNIFKI